MSDREELEASNEAWQADAKRFAANADYWQENCEAARAEVARLRAALADETGAHLGWKATAHGAEERAAKAEAALNAQRDALQVAVDKWNAAEAKLAECIEARDYSARERVVWRERAEALAKVALEVIKEIRSIGQRYRDDWSHFDGRTLKAELIEATDPLATALAAGKEGQAVKLAPTLQGMMFADFAVGDFDIAKAELRALLAVARAAREAPCGECGEPESRYKHPDSCRLGRALARLYRVSRPPEFMPHRDRQKPCIHTSER